MTFRRWSAMTLLCLFPTALLGADTDEKQKALDATLRQLEKDIAAARGLEFKSPVVARIVSRPKDGAKKVQGYYSTKEKALYVYDDVAGNYERGVLIHEMVHALQDQHFKLDKLHQEAFGSDAELAVAALIEGDATFTMIEVLKKDQPKVAAMLDSPLDKARDLQNAFLYAQGARYVKALKEKGGWAAVNRAYTFKPRTTAAILHPEGTSTFDLGPGKTLGELGLIKMMAEHPDTKPLAVEAAAGWKADRSGEDGKAKWHVFAVKDKDAAARLHAALVKRAEGVHKGLTPLPGTAAEKVWRDEGGAVRGVLATDDRVYTVEAPDEKTYRAALERLRGPMRLTVYDRKEKKEISFGQMIDRLLEADVVCVGESHDSDPHHRVQLQIIKALYAHDDRLGVGMEMFQRPFQKELDRYVKGEAAEEEMLRATEYKKRWGYDWGLYRPIVDFCRRNHLPVAALNLPDDLRAKLSKEGFDKMTEEEKKRLGAIDFHVKAHRDYWFDKLSAMHGPREVPADQKERGYQVMTAWDGYMAASAAAFVKERGVRRLVVLAGSGHIDRGFGIPDRAAKALGGIARSVQVVVGEDLKDHTTDPVADFIVVVR